MFHQEGGESLFNSRRCEIKCIYLFFMLFVLSPSSFCFLSCICSICHQHLFPVEPMGMHSYESNWRKIHRKLKMPKSRIEFVAARPWELHVALKQSLVRRRVIKVFSEFRVYFHFFHSARHCRVICRVLRLISFQHEMKLRTFIHGRVLEVLKKQL